MTYIMSKVIKDAMTAAKIIFNILLIPFINLK